MTTDTREMNAIHDAFRAEFGALPGMITAVSDGDTGRAEIVGGRVMMMTMMLHSHHSSEDVLLWPVLEQRVPERADFVHTMEAQHQRISELIEAAKAQAGPWMGTGSAAMAAELAATVTELDERMVEHLSIEEAEVLPLVVQHMTQEEFTAIGEHSRDSLTQDQLAVGLGLVLDDTSPELGEVLLSNMPPEARAGFEQFGMPLYVQYRARLNGAA
jgi:iron-sulfur cluster repair protein YtfE (RIC family)